MNELYVVATTLELRCSYADAVVLLCSFGGRSPLDAPRQFHGFVLYASRPVITSTMQYWPIKSTKQADAAVFNLIIDPVTTSFCVLLTWLLLLSLVSMIRCFIARTLHKTVLALCHPA